MRIAQELSNVTRAAVKKIKILNTVKMVVASHTLATELAKV
jgi:hypothetical protein